jgi:hypothetical protein
MSVFRSTAFNGVDDDKPRRAHGGSQVPKDKILYMEFNISSSSSISLTTMNLQRFILFIYGGVERGSCVFESVFRRIFDIYFYLGTPSWKQLIVKVTEAYFWLLGCHYCQSSFWVRFKERNKFKG